MCVCARVWLFFVYTNISNFCQFCIETLSVALKERFFLSPPFIQCVECKENDTMQCTRDHFCVVYVAHNINLCINVEINAIFVRTVSFPLDVCFAYFTFFHVKICTFSPNECIFNDISNMLTMPFSVSFLFFAFSFSFIN